MRIGDRFTKEVAFTEESIRQFAIYVGDIIYRADCIKLQVDLLGSGLQTRKLNGGKK